jgi:hypothetical protein
LDVGHASQTLPTFFWGDWNWPMAHSWGMSFSNPKPAMYLVQLAALELMVTSKLVVRPKGHWVQGSLWPPALQKPCAHSWDAPCR